MDPFDPSLFLFKELGYSEEKNKCAEKLLKRLQKYDNII